MLKPFHALLPERNKAHLVPSRSLETYDRNQLFDKLENNPYSFLQIIRPEMEVLLSNEDRFHRIRERLDDFIDKGIFCEDPQHSYYLYEQSKNGRLYTGIIGLLDVNKTKVYLHENTLATREALFSEYLITTGFQAEPVLMFGPSNKERKELITAVKERAPEVDFFTTDHTGHRMWHISGVECAMIEDTFSEDDSFFLADGHHRFGSTRRVANELSDNRAAQSILAMFMDEEEIGIESFERWVTKVDLPTLKAIEQIFEVVQKQRGFDEVEGDLEMFLNGTWYVLRAKQEIDRELPPSYLFDLFLHPILGLQDAKTDRRIIYVQQCAEDQSKRMVEAGACIGFRLPPVGVEVLKKTASTGGVMPPKSTYIEPKLRSGMVLHVFK